MILAQDQQQLENLIQTRIDATVGNVANNVISQMNNARQANRTEFDGLEAKFGSFESHMNNLIQNIIGGLRTDFGTLQNDRRFIRDALGQMDSSMLNRGTRIDHTSRVPRCSTDIE